MGVYYGVIFLSYLTDYLFQAVSLLCVLLYTELKLSTN
jgi:hypothetical protein